MIASEKRISKGKKLQIFDKLVERDLVKGKVYLEPEVLKRLTEVVKEIQEV